MNEDAKTLLAEIVAVATLFFGLAIAVNGCGDEFKVMEDNLK